MSVPDVAAELDHVAELLSGDVVAAARACLAEARALFADAGRGTARGEAEHAVALLDQALDDSEVPLSVVKPAMAELMATGGLRPNCVEWREWR